MEVKSNVMRLDISELDRIMDVERQTFIPTIQTTEEVIRRRLKQGHIYLGVQSEEELVGTLALRLAHFVPDFADFCKRNPTFTEYAEKDNERDANAIFVYSLGIIPSHRNGTNARNLLQGALNTAKQRGMDFLVGDARIPSYNGSNQHTQYEKFEINEDLHKAVDEYFRTGAFPPRSLIERDPVAGFYLRIFPKGKILGITNNQFWKGDEPCMGHMVIEYLKLK